jgi:hypothetical protein
MTLSDELYLFVALAIGTLVAVGITLLIVKKFLPKQAQGEFNNRQGIINRLRKQIPEYAQRSEAEQQIIANKVAAHPVVIAYMGLIVGGLLWVGVSWSPLVDFINGAGSKKAAYAVGIPLLFILFYGVIFIHKQLAIKMLQERL